jgi:transposase
LGGSGSLSIVSFQSRSNEANRVAKTSFDPTYHTSIQQRQKIVTAYDSENTSIIKLAQGFDVSKAFVQRLLKQQKIKGHLQPGKQGGTIPNELDGYLAQLVQMVDKYPDATRS